jgi:hypothetical protein
MIGNARIRLVQWVSSGSAGGSAVSTQKIAWTITSTMMTRPMITSVIQPRLEVTSLVNASILILQVSVVKIAKPAMYALLLP